MLDLNLSETENERKFYENCQVNDTSYWRRDEQDRHKKACGIRVLGLFYCTRAHGHGGTRCVAEGETLVLAVLDIQIAQ